MKKIYIIDDATKARGQIFEDCLGTVSDEEAIERAELAWSYLTEDEQKRRDGFWVAEYDEYGEDDICTDINYETERMIKRIK